MPSEQQIDEGMAFLKEHWPERHALMAQLRVDDPEAFALVFRKAWPQLARMIELSRHDPELAKVETALVIVEFKIRRATRAYRAAVRRKGPAGAGGRDGSEPQGRSEEQLSRLKELVGRRFDLQIKRSELRIQELAEQLSQQRQRLERQRRNKQDEVARIVKRLTSEWFPPGGFRGFRPGAGKGKFRDRPWSGRRLAPRGAGRVSGDLPRNGNRPANQPLQAHPPSE